MFVHLLYNFKAATMAQSVQQLGCGLDDRGLESREGQVFSLLQNVQTASRDVIFLLSRYCGSFPGVKRPEREFYHSLLSTADVKKQWRCTSVPPYGFVAWTGKTLLLQHTLNYVTVQGQKIVKLNFSLSTQRRYMGSRVIAPLIHNLGSRQRIVTSRLGRITRQGNSPGIHLIGVGGGTHSRSGRFAQEKNLFPMPGIEPRVAQPVAQSLY